MIFLLEKDKKISIEYSSSLGRYGKNVLSFWKTSVVFTLIIGVKARETAIMIIKKMEDVAIFKASIAGQLTWKSKIEMMNKRLNNKRSWGKMMPRREDQKYKKKPYIKHCCKRVEIHDRTKTNREVCLTCKLQTSKI